MFTHADKGELQTVTFTWDSIRNWSWRVWTLMAAILVSVSGALYECVTYYVSFGLFWVYTGAIIVIIIIYASVTIIYKDSLYLHIHHYNIGYFIVFLAVI